MDAFFASIEQRDRPNLKNKPVVVGGHPDKRGVVCAASYEARKYGIKSAMASRKAKQLCPNAVFVPTNKRRYKEVSKTLRQIFTTYSTRIEPISLDEAFIDVTGNDPIIIGQAIKRDIMREVNLTGSVGVSYNKFLAKLASDMDKPNGFTVIKKEGVKALLKNLSIRKLWGVGPKTEAQLHRLGIYKIGDLQDYDKTILEEKFGKRGVELLDFSNGIDHRPVEWNGKPQSISEENTFDQDIMDRDQLHEKLSYYTQDVINELKKNRYKIKTITIKLKYEDFTSETRSITLASPTDNEQVIMKMAHHILDQKFQICKKVRLLGVTVSNLVYPDEPIQLSFDMG